MIKIIGILALQGDFAKHAEHIQKLGALPRLVKKPADLEPCGGLIIPGGESTTMTKLIDCFGLHEPLRAFARNHPVLGTCAGLIMVARQVDDERVKPLNLIDIAVSRNAYGRQIDSFSTELSIPFLNGSGPFHAVFIRAPQILATGPEVETLIEYNHQPVMVRNKQVIALAFHPELTDDSRIHEYFLKECRE
ncbi:MAG: pyridoxal 5'-phosphate synthase glutaminase subunit PdxT [Desulfobacteraceae bacterium]|nr:MAG: pyridoxal 5'-phosphate synthase glutaminase subunit PdxT [Desulfobacteraceae bacterium]